MTPQNHVLDCLILALKNSAKILVDRFTEKFKTPSWCSVKVEIITWKFLDLDLSALSSHFAKDSLAASLWVFLEKIILKECDKE